MCTREKKLARDFFFRSLMNNTKVEVDSIVFTSFSNVGADGARS